jgi:ribosomal protein L12E/L44/L45/RPP1/RPP2
VIQNGFPAQLKDCSSALAKNMALASSPFGKKTEQKEPKAFMTQCVMDGVRQKFPIGADEYLKPVESFVQNILNAASAAGGGLDVKKLSSAIGGMNVDDLIDELDAKAADDICALDEPYEPPAAPGGREKRGDKKEESILSPGFRTGFNFSHLSAAEGSYNSTAGFQAGLVLDIAASEVFHIQPGLMYIQKGAEDKNGDALTFHYIEAPLLLSLKFSAFRLNAGPYFGLCVDGEGEDFDIGISAGLGFDIWMFYIGMFYDYGLLSPYHTFDNRTLGFNFGVNL